MVSLTEIASIETIIAQIAQRRVFIRRRINELSPTGRIPSEILIEIFRIACQPVKNDYRANKSVTPFFIGSICSRWRDVAWSTPLLWNTILLHVSRKYDGQVQLLGDRLLNAKSAPLSIRLILDEDEDEDDILCAFEAIMRTLITRSNYWLTFDSDLLPQCHHVLKNIDFPMLTSVSLQSTNIISTPNISGMFLTAPKLVDVSLIHYNPKVLLPWEQVRRLRIELSSGTECLEALRQSPNLQECHIECIHSTVSFISKTIIHTQLKVLDVMSSSRDASVSLFDSISLPSLSNLRIRCNGTNRLLSSITSLVIRSSCNLERFTIEFTFDDADLISCLEAIPSLTHLDLIYHDLGLEGLDVGLTKHLVASLDPLSNSSQLLLPNLQYFKYQGPVLCDCRTILDMLAHRWHLSDDDGTSQSIRVSKLRLAGILSTVEYHVTADVQEELKDLSEEGMLVRIISG